MRLCFSPDGKTLAAIGLDYFIQRWGADGKRLENTAGQPGLPVGAIMRLAYADNQRIIAWMTVNQLAFAWEVLGQTLLSPETLHHAPIWSIALPVGQKTLISSGMDGKQFGWDLETGQENFAFDLTPARLPAQPLTKPVVTLFADGTRAVWPAPPAPEIFDLSSGASELVVPLPSTAPTPVHIGTSPDGSKLFTVSRQTEKRRTGACVVWDLVTRQRLAEFDVEPSGNAAAPTAMLSPDSTQLALITVRVKADNTTSLLVVGYDLKTGKKLAQVEDPILVSGSIAVVVADNEWLVATSTSGRVWKVNYAKGAVGTDLDKLPVRGEVPVHGPIMFSPDGKRFAIGVVGEPHTTYGARVYDWPQGKPLKTCIGHRGPVTALRFSSDGNFLATGTQDTSVLLWDLTKVPHEK